MAISSPRYVCDCDIIGMANNEIEYSKILFFHKSISYEDTLGCVSANRPIRRVKWIHSLIFLLRANVKRI